jgi:hypothetical protein
VCARVFVHMLYSSRHVSPKLDEQINVEYMYMYICVRPCVCAHALCSRHKLNLYPIIASNSEVVPVCRIVYVLPVDPAVVEILNRI